MQYIFTNVNNNGYTLYKRTENMNDFDAILKDLHERAAKKKFSRTFCRGVDEGCNTIFSYMGNDKNGKYVCVDVILVRHENFLDIFMANHSVH